MGPSPATILGLSLFCLLLVPNALGAGPNGPCTGVHGSNDLGEQCVGIHRDGTCIGVYLADRFGNSECAGLTSLPFAAEIQAAMDCAKEAAVHGDLVGCSLP